MPVEWVGSLISGAAVVLVAVIEAAAARERKRVKADNRRPEERRSHAGRAGSVTA